MSKIIHVGLPKCASTSLQVLFIQAKGTTFLGKGANATGLEAVKDWMRRTFLGEPPRFRESLYPTKAIRDIFRDALPSDRILSDDEIAAMRAELDTTVRGFKGDPAKLLVSDEVLSGAGFIFFNEPRRRLEGIIQTAGRLFGPDALVVVVMRSQLPFLTSYWKHLIRTGYPFTFGHFLSEQSDDFATASSWRSVTASLFYDHVRRAAAEAGVRVAFVPFEDVTGDQTMLRRVFADEGITMPPGLPHRRRTASDESHILKLKRNRTALRKRGNMFTPEQLQADEPGFRWVIENNTLFDPTPHRERLIEAFRPENRAFAAATGYDLAKMKYPV